MKTSLEQLRAVGASSTELIAGQTVFFGGIGCGGGLGVGVTTEFFGISNYSDGAFQLSSISKKDSQLESKGNYHYRKVSILW